MYRRGLIAAAAAAPALAAAPLVVVELFTSQSCDSCPSADAVLRELAPRRDVLALSWHVTYWNRLGWQDRFSLPEATERQRRYARTVRDSLYGQHQVYTPQMVVQGAVGCVGSNRAMVGAALREAATLPVALTLRGDAGGLEAVVPEGQGRGTLLLVGFDPEHVTPVSSGENRGRTLVHAHVVRSLVELGAWSGAASQLRAPRPAGQSHALLLQGADGRILGAARA